MSEIISNTARINSCAVHFLEAGGSGRKTVILLHGMKFSAATWQETGTLQRLADNGFHALAVDMPGFGRSPACSVNQEEILEHFIVGAGNGVVLVGPSMGGRIALEFAISHPASLAGLVLVGAVGVLENKKQLSGIHVPTLLVWGGEDQVSPVANCEILHNSIPGSCKVVIDGAPHPCYLDNAEKWNRELLHFLDTKLK